MRALGVIAAFAVVTVSAAMASAADLELGKKVFASKCAMCHGPDGKGNAKMAAMLKVSVPDLTSVANKTDSDLSKFVASGKKPMPSFSSLSKEELDAVVHYVKSIGTGSVAGK